MLAGGLLLLGLAVQPPVGEAVPTAAPTGKMAVEWSPPPPCQNRPQGLAAWRARLEEPAGPGYIEAYLHRGRSFTPIWAGITPAELLAYLDVPDTAADAALARRELSLLWLNILDERLNRASELHFAALPEVKTVGDLLAQLEQARLEDHLPASLLAASSQLQAGQGIERAVCARLLYRDGTVIKESLWTDEGTVEQRELAADVPLGITHFSPDYSRLVVETAWGDTAGGPLYLVDLATGQQRNLNELIGHEDYSGPSALTVGGWHPDNQHLLLVEKAENVAYWLNLADESYRPIALEPVVECALAPVRQVELAPAGDSFVFALDGPEGQTMLNQYNLAHHRSSLLATLPVQAGRCKSFHLSPQGDKAAYVVPQGSRRTGLSYALELFDLESQESTPLLEGNLGRTEPLWSPDGQFIALARKTGDEPDIAGVGHARPWRGNIWLVSPTSGEAHQLTFVQGAASHPVWSPGGRYLAFTTHAHQVGLVSVADPGPIWPLGSLAAQAHFKAMALVP